MYPDNLFSFQTMYLIPNESDYDCKRETFNKMTSICKDLVSDIGYSDMLLQFDSVANITEAELRLTEAKINWIER
jgi:hypothetical protein